VEASLTVDPTDVVTSIDPRMFGSFVEHLGRVVYTGIYEPGHPSSDANGLRHDVLELVRDLGLSVVRYPGGNFVSAYRWEDGVGPRHQRPIRAEPAWRAVETNQFGLGEFMDWAGHARVEPMMVVNLGTRGVAEAQDLVEYCNHPGGTYWSDQRRAHGAAQPHNIRLWGLGNEMDGHWQVGHKTADEYGRLAAETARAMRLIDPTIELVVAGSSLRSMPTFPQWDATVLEHTYEDVDYLSLHGYYYKDQVDLPTFLASAVDLDRYIDEAIATCDYVRAKKRSTKPMVIAFDEWNITYREQPTGQPTPWSQAPAFGEYDQDSLDAVVIGTLLLSFLRHAERVRITCQALLVNVGGVIRTRPGGPAWRQASFFPLAHVARWAKGDLLRLRRSSPSYATPTHGLVALLEAAATYDSETGSLAVFAVNRHLTDPLRLTMQVTGARRTLKARHTYLQGSVDHPLNNTADQPNTVEPTDSDIASDDDGTFLIELAPLSWNMLRVSD
jgi:alpha-L-arabinofuranosidase